MSGEEEAEEDDDDEDDEVEESNESSRVAEKDIKALVILRTARIIGSVRDVIGAIVKVTCARYEVIICDVVN